MIVILDNDEGYSVHEIRFVDIGPMPPWPTTDLLLKHAREARTGQDAEPFAIALVESLDWRKSDALVPVHALWQRIDEHACLVERCRDEEARAPGARSLGRPPARAPRRPGHRDTSFRAA